MPSPARTFIFTAKERALRTAECFPECQFFSGFSPCEELAGKRDRNFKRKSLFERAGFYVFSAVPLYPDARKSEEAVYDPADDCRNGNGKKPRRDEVARYAPVHGREPFGCADAEYARGDNMGRADGHAQKGGPSYHYG